VDRDDEFRAAIDFAENCGRILKLTIRLRPNPLQRAVSMANGSAIYAPTSLGSGSAPDWVASLPPGVRTILPPVDGYVSIPSATDEAKRQPEEGWVLIADPPQLRPLSESPTYVLVASPNKPPRRGSGATSDTAAASATSLAIPSGTDATDGQTNASATTTLAATTTSTDAATVSVTTSATTSISTDGSVVSTPTPTPTPIASVAASSTSSISVGAVAPLVSTSVGTSTSVSTSSLVSTAPPRVNTPPATVTVTTTTGATSTTSSRPLSSTAPPSLSPSSLSSFQIPSGIANLSFTSPPSTSSIIPTMDPRLSSYVTPPPSTTPTHSVVMPPAPQPLHVMATNVSPPRVSGSSGSTVKPTPLSPSQAVVIVLPTPSPVLGHQGPSIVAPAPPPGPMPDSIQMPQHPHLLRVTVHPGMYQFIPHFFF
jgi:hypothetical protein